jgi:hypothetical protein
MLQDLFQALYEAGVVLAVVAIVWAISNKIWGEQ